MKRGRQSRKLSAAQIAQLAEIRRRRRLSIPAFREFMKAPFDSWQTLREALAGRPIWVLNADFIVEWLDGYKREQARLDEQLEKDAAKGRSERAAQPGAPQVPAVRSGAR